MRSASSLPFALLTGLALALGAGLNAHADPPAGGPSTTVAADAGAPIGATASAGSASASASGSSSESPPDKPPRLLVDPSLPINTCANCHEGLPDPKLRAPVKPFLSSVHKDERIGCAGCHGGDPRDPTVQAHRSSDFVPHPAHADVASICGGCHSDATFIQHFNSRLPVGQALLFNVSLHGKLANAGDALAPACSDCHGIHDVQHVVSPEAPVNRVNIAKLCSKCHSDPERMKNYDLRTDQYSGWEKSVHGQAFLKGNPNAPACNGCHGAHASTPPNSSSVGRACGRCHEKEMSFFEQSVHSQEFRKRGLAECVACHGNHDIEPATALMVGTTGNATCTKCHKDGDAVKPLKVASDIATLLGRARDRAAEGRAALEKAHERGLRIPGESLALLRVTTAEQELRAYVHTLDPSRLEAPVAKVDQAVDDALKLVADAERTRKNERRGYFVSLGIGSVLLLLLVLKSFDLSRRRKQAGP